MTVRVKTYLLGRFYMVLALAGVTLYTGMSTGFGLFYKLLWILGLTTAVSFVWTWLGVAWLEVTVDRRTRRAHVGETLEERITVKNVGRFPKPPLEVDDITDLPGYSSGLVVSLPREEARTWRTAIPARKRGVYTLGPVRAVSTDVFGLFRRERRFGGADPIVIYPRIHEVPSFQIPTAHLSGDNTTRKRSHDLTPHAASVREYAFGDSISRVHWNSTARLGKLMSKEFDLDRSGDIWILVDLHRDVQAGELEESTDEYAVSIAASLARRYLDSGLPIGLVAYGDQRFFLPPETGSAHFDRILELLAMSKAEGNTNLSNVLTAEETAFAYNAALVVITPSHRSDWPTALRALARRRVRVAVILLDSNSFGGYFDTTAALPLLEEAGLPTYLVRKGDHIPAALSQVFVSTAAKATEPVEVGS